MATSASFNDMLKDYMPYQLLVEELKRHNYFFSKVKKRTGWKGGDLKIPFEGSEASSLSFGALSSTSDVAEHTDVIGTISTQPELWGTMIFREKDLDRHDGDMAASYLQILPGKVQQFVEQMTERVSVCMLGDNSICRILDTYNGANADDPTNGIVYVDRPKLLRIGEKINIDDDDSSPVTTAYVTAINRNTHLVTIKDARSAGNAVDLSAYTQAQNAKIYLPGGVTAGFSGLKSQLLSNANGGSSTLYGQTKTAYPFLQAQNYDGSIITQNNILDVVNGYFFDASELGSGNPTEILMSYNNFKNCVNALQVNKRYAQGDKKGGYGFSSIELLGGDGNQMMLTAIRDLPNDYMVITDWDGLEVHGDKFFERKRHQNGDEFFLERATTGYSYVVDVKFYGDLVVKRPSSLGIIYNISYSG